MLLSFVPSVAQDRIRVPNYLNQATQAIRFGPDGGEWEPDWWPERASALSTRIESSSRLVRAGCETAGVNRIGGSEPISQPSARGYHRGQGLVGVSILVYKDKEPK